MGEPSRKSTQTNDFGSNLNLPTPTRSADTFIGWFVDGDLTQVAPTTMPSQDITLFAKWDIYLDPNVYSVVGNFQGWNIKDDRVIMTRQTGTNTFSFTVNLSVNTEWKLVFNQSWESGEVSPHSDGVTIQENGITVANFTSAGGTNMTSAGFNFKTKVDGNYTIFYTSFPSLNRILNIVRNGATIIVDHPDTREEMLINPDFSLGTTGWDEGLPFFVGDGANLSLSTENGELKADVVAGPDSFSPRFGQENIPFVYGKTYSVSFDARALTQKAIEVQIGKLYTSYPWFNNYLPEFNYKFFNLTTVMTNYNFTFTHNINSVEPTGSILFSLGRVMGSRVNTTIFFDNFLIEEIDLNQSNTSFQTYGGMTASETNEGLLINYVNTPVNFWESGAFLKFVNADGTKTELKVDFTGVAGTTYLFKFEKQGGNNASGISVEFDFVGTGAAQTATMSLTALTAAQRAEMNNFVVFVKTPTTTGAVTISRIYYA
jgi:uncharacterized repeat protein (TIGR02543 family)